ncbi:hypothetical protein KKF84_00010 [Myxococcota bacterium]|nr:hypothetical protein [Myxococcota bacterium]MBU1533667.1 hypothetical protein [Myxococcota bacterium]
MKRASLILLSALFLLFSCEEKITYNAPTCGNGTVETGEECDDGNVISGDGCSAQCYTELFEICDNKTDDDGDGLIDCADPECFSDQTCEGEICNNGIDDDSDGFVDCDDPECLESDFCIQSEDCTNGKDDDFNGYTDCADSQCSTHPLCGGCDPHESHVEIIPGVSLNLSPHGFDILHTLPCTASATGFFEARITVDAGVSLSLDGTFLLTPFTLSLTREEEPDVTCELDSLMCLSVNSPQSLPFSLPLLPPGSYRLLASGGAVDLELHFGDPVFEKCDNGYDDDLNGLVDCEDPVCAQDIHCLVEICDNGADDDLDGEIDCDDPDCAVFCAPAEICSNGMDDDLDGAIDCHDFDCIGTADCDNSICVVHSWLGELSRGSLVSTTFDTTLTPHSFTTSCGGPGPDYVIAFDLLGPSNLLVHMTQTGAHALALATDSGSELCVDGELSCATPGGIHLPITQTYSNLPSGSYYLLVDAVTFDGSGLGEVQVQVIGTDDEFCTNGIDDDQDSLIDCDDPDCQALSFCAGETLCHNDTDDDLDGWYDCADNDCIGSTACQSTACIPDRHLGTLSDAPLSAMVDLASGTREMILACGSQQSVPGSVLSFALASAGKVRIRTIPIGFSEPVTALAFPAGTGSDCSDAQHLCSVVPAPGLANTVITQVSLPAGGPYYILVSPYSPTSNGVAQVIVSLDP